MDPITFEVIRNALVAATDEMVLDAPPQRLLDEHQDALRLLVRVLRRRAARRSRRASRSPCTSARWSSRCRARSATTAPRTSSPGDVIITNEPFPSGVHLNDVSLISPVHHDGELLGYVANLAHHVDVGGGAPASIGAFREVFQEGVIIPPVKVVEGGRIVRRRLRPDPGADPLQARDRPATSARRSRRTRPACAGCRRSSPATAATTVAGTMRELLDYTERRTRAEIAALPHGVYEAEGTRRHRRLHRRAGAAAGAGRDHGRRRRASTSTGSDPQRRAPVNSTYAQTFSACAYAVKCLIDPDLPGQRRLLPRSSRSTRRAGTVDELHLAEPGRRRLGDADAARRRDLPRAPPRAARAAARGDEGDDVPRRLRRRRRRERTSTTASSRRSAAATAAAPRATGRTRCRRTARTPRTRRSRRPS